MSEIPENIIATHQLIAWQREFNLIKIKRCKNILKNGNLTPDRVQFLGTLIGELMRENIMLNHKLFNAIDSIELPEGLSLKANRI